MILKGNARGGAKDLALHLMKAENEHVELHELRGFASETLMGALNEAYAISRGTRCKQFLYSLSLNPPQTENVPVADFETAIEKVEEQLGLTDQPRAIVFHEKEGRRHAHCIWSRIDVTEMKAIQLSYDRMQLKQISRELYLDQGWKMPEGLSDTQKRDPRNYSLAQWQQAKRSGRNAADIKAAIQDAWAISDNKASFVYALEERGFKLARGNKSRFVAVDVNGEAYAIARQTKLKAREIKSRLGDPKNLLDVDSAHQLFAQEMQLTFLAMKKQLKAKYDKSTEGFEKRRIRLVTNQRHERERLEQRQHVRDVEEVKQRQSRFRKGLGGIWDRLRGEHKRIGQLNEAEATSAKQRDHSERDQLVQRHLSERRHLGLFRSRLRDTYNNLQREITHDRQVLQNRNDVSPLIPKPRGPSM